MKVDIPDKILINRGEDGRLHHSYWTTDQELVPFEDTLYIRKDALIEWANKRLEEFCHIAEISNDVAADGEVDAFEELIDKLNSM